jgi:3-oxoacyl-[acyl-carrier protein] reductase
MGHELLEDGFPFAEGALSGRRALICGASKGIGRACALMLARAGCGVIACARSEEELNDLVLEMHGDSHEYRVLDLEDLGEVRRVAKEISDSGPVEILLNNSGGPPRSPLLDNEIIDFDSPFRRHLHASHELVRALVPGMVKSGMGRIVNIISISVREPIDGIGLSNTLRGAMASWSKSLSRELDPCITINNILPGYTDTDRLVEFANSMSSRNGKPIGEIYQGWRDATPIGRLIDPMEIGSAVVWLSLPATSAVRGMSLAVDGGRLRTI